MHTDTEPTSQVLLLTKQKSRKKKLTVLLFSSAHCLTTFIFFFFPFLTPHLTAPTKTISLLGERQSITLPQHGTIRLILARVAPNLAASEQWV